MCGRKDKSDDRYFHYVWTERMRRLWESLLLICYCLNESLNDSEKERLSSYIFNMSWLKIIPITNVYQFTDIYIGRAFIAKTLLNVLLFLHFSKSHEIYRNLCCKQKILRVHNCSDIRYISINVSSRFSVWHGH